MDFHNVFTFYVVKVKESIADIPTELYTMFKSHRWQFLYNPMSTINSEEFIIIY